MAKSKTYHTKLDTCYAFIRMKAGSLANGHPQLFEDLVQDGVCFVLRRIEKKGGVRLTSIKDRMRKQRTRIISQVLEYINNNPYGRPQRQYLDEAPFFDDSETHTQPLPTMKKQETE